MNQLLMQVHTRGHNHRHQTHYSKGRRLRPIFVSLLSTASLPSIQVNTHRQSRHARTNHHVHTPIMLSSNPNPHHHRHISRLLTVNYQSMRHRTRGNKYTTLRQREILRTRDFDRHIIRTQINAININIYIRVHSTNPSRILYRATLNAARKHRTKRPRKIIHRSRVSPTLSNLNHSPHNQVSHRRGQLSHNVQVARNRARQVPQLNRVQEGPPLRLNRRVDRPRINPTKLRPAAFPIWTKHTADYTANPMRNAREDRAIVHPHPNLTAARRHTRVIGPVTTLHVHGGTTPHRIQKLLPRTIRHYIKGLATPFIQASLRSKLRLYKLKLIFRMTNEIAYHP